MSEPTKCSLTLYIGGQSHQSLRAVRNLKALADRHLSGSNPDITVCDLLEQPELARKENILALPTLVRENPAPQTRVIGDLSDIDKVWSALSDL